MRYLRSNCLDTFSRKLGEGVYDVTLGDAPLMLPASDPKRARKMTPSPQKHAMYCRAIVGHIAKAHRELPLKSHGPNLWVISSWPSP